MVLTFCIFIYCDNFSFLFCHTVKILITWIPIKTEFSFGHFFTLFKTFCAIIITSYISRTLSGCSLNSSHANIMNSACFTSFSSLEFFIILFTSLCLDTIEKISLLKMNNSISFLDIMHSMTHTLTLFHITHDSDATTASKSHPHPPHQH